MHVLTILVHPGPEVIKLYMLNSVKHEILNAHRYKNIKKYGSKPRMLFFPAHKC